MVKSKRWHKTRIEGVECWERDGYIICLNINKGISESTGVRDRLGHFWWFELVRRTPQGEQYIGEGPTLEVVKQLKT